jgi:hypothetical protein
MYMLILARQLQGLNLMLWSEAYFRLVNSQGSPVSFDYQILVYKAKISNQLQLAYNTYGVGGSTVRGLS